MASYETIWKFNCGLCGKHEEGTNIYDNWGELKYGARLWMSRKNEKDVCPECLNKILQLKNV